MRSVIHFALASSFAVSAAAPAQTSTSADTLHDAFADVNGIHPHYRIGGRGPALVLLHGLTHSAAWWDSLAPVLMTDHTVIAPDLRGHGRSNNPSGVFRHPLAAADILQLLTHLGIRDFSGIGHSSGAGIFLHMAAMEPDRVKAMMVIGLGHRIASTAPTAPPA